MNKKLTKQDALLLLQQKAEQLKQQGENRFPKRSDFSDKEVVAIKAFLGPWPRALEAAGVKAPKNK
ncbi:MAG: hypothetical protein IKC47_01435 [Clostridia bacterium]|nr:hypothetical protein [Clostridia bacterium]